MSKLVIFTVGLPCSGKSTYIKENLKDFTIISSDDIKESLQGYSPEDAVNVHEDSVQKAKLQLMDLASKGINNLLMDGGGINNSYTKDLILFCNNLGYTIKCIYFNTPIEICLKRLANRERKVPLEAMYYKNQKLNASVNMLKSISHEFEEIKYFSDDHIFVDMDGTLCNYQTPNLDIDNCVDFVNSKYFLYATPVPHIISLIKKLKDEGKKIYILTACPNIISWKEKLVWCSKHVPFIDQEDILFVGNKTYKHVFLKHFALSKKINYKDILLIDDNYETIKNTFKLGMNSIHPSNTLYLNK